MLPLDRKKVSTRKLRLFACACCRRVWDSIELPRGWKAIEIAEQFADGFARKKQRVNARMADFGQSYFVSDVLADNDHLGEQVRYTAQNVASRAAYTACGGSTLPEKLYSAAWDAEANIQSNLLREVFGNPFRPVTLSTAWRTPQAVALGQAAYDQRTLPAGTLDPARLAVLADALEEAGCTDADLLGHLRGPGPHVRGCWAVDLLLGKE
jgi:hypothetical protein